MNFRRLDQRVKGVSEAGSGPAPSNVLTVRTLIVIGPGGGEFVYDASGNLRSSNVGATTTDPIHGTTVFQGFTTFNGFGAALNYLSTVAGKGGFIQYLDNGSSVQGTLILSINSETATWVEPYAGVTVQVGQEGIDPVFGDSINLIGANIHLAQVAYTRSADVVAIAASGVTVPPYILVDAPEQTTAQHVQMQLQGYSPDGVTATPQCLIGVVSGGAVLASNGHGMLQIQPLSGQGGFECITPTGTVPAFITKLPADTNDRWQINTNGVMKWGSGTAVPDVQVDRAAANLLELRTADFDVATTGRGLQVAEGSNAKQGTATLAGGTSGAIANTAVTASSRIFLTAQDNNSTGALRVSARVAGTSFTITSSNAGDSGVVAYEIFEPG